MLEIWQWGLVAGLALSAVGLVASIFAYLHAKSGCCDSEVTVPARMLLFSLFGGPLVSLLWPVAVLVALGWGGYKVVNDAWPS